MGLCSSNDDDAKQRAAEVDRQARFAEFGARLHRNNLARDKFTELDVDKNGTLNGQELQLMAMWVWEGYYEKPPTYRQLHRFCDQLLAKRDKDGNNEISWDEFVGLYEQVTKDWSD